MVINSLEPTKIAAKCIEVNRCLLDKEVGLFCHDLEATRCIGDAAMFAANIKQGGYIGADQAVAIATVLKQDIRTLKAVILPKLEKLGWVKVYYDGNKIRQIAENVPPVEDILRDLGILWEEQSPTDIDRATIETMSLLTKKPYNKEALASDLDIKDSTLETALNYGTETNYFGTFKSLETGQDIVWSPLYWAGKTDRVKKFLKRQTYAQFEEIELIIDQLLKYPGIPLDIIKRSREEALLNSGIGCGLFPSIGVEDRQGLTHDYVFAATPHFELDPSKDIFEKARLIVACVRHGQYNAEISRIRYPVSLLRALREGRIGPHSYARIQYAVLVKNRICTYETNPSYGGSVRPVLIDTPENLIAFDVAEELLKGEEPTSGSLDLPDVKELLIGGSAKFSQEQRQIKNAAKVVARGEFDRLIEAIQGSGAIS